MAKNQHSTGIRNLAELYRAQGRYREAELLYQRALALRERVLGPEHPHVADCLENYIALLRATNRNEEAVAVYDEVVRRFGPGMLLPDGTLDRAQLAALVFADESSRAALNEIVHPEVGREVAKRIEAFRDTDTVVVVDVPLMVESGGTAGFDAILVVSAPGWLRIERLSRDRGMRDADVRARIASQASDEQRRKIATHLIENTGTLEQLEHAVDRFWEDVSTG